VRTGNFGVQDMLRSKASETELAAFDAADREQE